MENDSKFWSNIPTFLTILSIISELNTFEPLNLKSACTVIVFEFHACSRLNRCRSNGPQWLNWTPAYHRRKDKTRPENFSTIIISRFWWFNKHNFFKRNLRDTVCCSLNALKHETSSVVWLFKRQYKFFTLKLVGPCHSSPISHFYPPCSKCFVMEKNTLYFQFSTC